VALCLDVCLCFRYRAGVPFIFLATEGGVGKGTCIGYSFGMEGEGIIGFKMRARRSKPPCAIPDSVSHHTPMPKAFLE